MFTEGWAERLRRRLIPVESGQLAIAEAGKFQPKAHREDRVQQSSLYYIKMTLNQNVTPRLRIKFNIRLFY